MRLTSGSSKQAAILQNYSKQVTLQESLTYQRRANRVSVHILDIWEGYWSFLLS